MDYLGSDYLSSKITANLDQTVPVPFSHTANLETVEKASYCFCTITHYLTFFSTTFFLSGESCHESRRMGVGLSTDGHITVGPVPLSNNNRPDAWNNKSLPYNTDFFRFIFMVGTEKTKSIKPCKCLRAQDDAHWCVLYQSRIDKTVSATSTTNGKIALYICLSRHIAQRTKCERHIQINHFYRRPHVSYKPLKVREIVCNFGRRSI